MLLPGKNSFLHTVDRSVLGASGLMSGELPIDSQAEDLREAVAHVSRLHGLAGE